MCNIVITGVTGMRNRGVEALIVPIVQQLRLRVPSAQLSVVTQTPDYDDLRLGGDDVTFVRDCFPDFEKSRLLRWRAHGAQYWGRLLPMFQKMCAMIRSATIIIATGGDIFGSDYGCMRRHLWPLRIAIDAGVPVVLLAQSVGPFKTTKEAEVFRSVAQRCRFLTVRERMSYEYVTNELGISTDRIHLTADPAFLLEPVGSESARALREFYGISTVRPTVAVAASRGIEQYALCDSGRHERAWSDVVEMMVQKFDVDVLFVPHVQECDSRNDDRVTATRLLRRLGYNDRVHVAAADHTASEFKSLIGMCEMVIAERMHAAIAGLSSGVCTVAVGYSVKAKGIMRELFAETRIAGKVLIPIESFLDSETACSVVQSAWAERKMVASELQSNLARVKEQSVRNFSLLTRSLAEDGVCVA